MTAAVVGLALVFAGVIGVIAWLASIAISRTAEVGKAQVATAVAEQQADNVRADLRVAERDLAQERARAASLEEELYVRDQEVVLDRPDPSVPARNRVLSRWRAVNGGSGGDAGRAALGGIVSGTVTVPHPAAGGDGSADDS